MALRGTNIAYVNNVTTGSISLPAGSTAGDYAVLFVENLDPAVAVPPHGFRYVSDTVVNGVCGVVFECHLTAVQIADFTANGLQVGFGYGGFNSYGILAIAVFVGAQAGVRTLTAATHTSGALTETVTTNGTPVAGDYALYFATGETNPGITITSSGGASLQTTSNAFASGALYGGVLGASGAVSSTFTFSANPVRDFEIIVVVAPSPKAGLQLRAPLLVLESAEDGGTSITSVRASFVANEALSDSVRDLRQALLVNEALEDSFRTLRMPLLCIEALYPVLPEGTVSTELFPGSLGSPIALPGLQWPVHKRPLFNTEVYKGSSGVSVRRANMQFPIWEFDLSYEFLRDSVNQEFQTLLDFFLARQGGFDTFLFKDKDDYQVTNGFLATADGVTTQFAFVRSFGGTFYDKVGQVDNGNTITLYGTVAENGTVPNLPGPYTITVTNSATFVADVKVTKAGVPMTKVASAPAAGQYSVAAGVYTFNSADNSAAVVITYRYTLNPASYTITLPNLVVFGSAPASGLIISADFQFFFNCRFQDDTADFDKFAVTFWELQKIVLETVPQ